MSRSFSNWLRWLTCCRRYLTGIACMVVGLSLAACGTSAEPPEPVFLRIAGAGAVRPLLKELTSEYVARNSHVTFDLQGGGPRVSLGLLEVGQADMAALSWLPSEEDLRERAETGKPLLVTVIAADGLVLIVHPKNPVSELSSAQARGLFGGHIPDWRDVGGRVGDVLVISREDDSSDRDTFETLIMGKQPVTLGAIVMPGSQDVVSYVAGHPNAIGYVAFGEITPEVKPLTIDGVEPTVETIRDGSYSLWRHLALVSDDPPSAGVQAFLDYAAGSSGQDIVSAYYDAVR